MSNPAHAQATDKRDAILEAALHLFGTLGFHGTAVPRIAEAARVGAGTIYRHFESKENLVNVLYRDLKSRYGAHLLDGFPLHLPARDQLKAYWQRKTDFVRQQPEAFQFIELHHHADYLDADSRALEDRLLEVPRGVIVGLQAQGVLKPIAPEIIFSLMHGGFVGLFKAWRTGALDLTDDRVRDDAEQCMWEAIRR